MPKLEYNHGTVFCVCKRDFIYNVEDRLSDLLYEEPYTSEITHQKEIECPYCKAKIQIEFLAMINVKVNLTKLEFKGQSALDLDDGIFPLTALEGAFVGDKFPLPDGNYIAGTTEYQIKNETVIDYWQIADNNQLSLLQGAA